MDLIRVTFMNKKQQSITYNELISAFKCTKNKMLPAEMHGYLSGLICGGNCMKGPRGLKINSQMLGEDFFTKPENQKTIARMMVIIIEQLQDTDFEFRLMLPEDEKIKHRMEALTKWCKQFVSGLGIGGIDQKFLEQTKLSETLYDIVEISSADYHHVKQEESAEFSYVELVEYVRLAAVNFFMETCGGANAIEQPSLPEMAMSDDSLLH